MKNIVTEKTCSKCNTLKQVDKFPKVGARCKSCVYEYQKEWVSKNPEKANATYKRYADNHPEKMKAKGKRKYELFKERFVEEIKKWRIANPEKQKESTRLWWIGKEAKRSEYNKTQRTNHPDAVRMNNENRRALERNATGKITKEDWQALLVKYEYRCLCCGASNVKLSLDHVVPLSKGGTHTIENAQPLCLVCNSKKGTKHTDYRKEY